MLERTIETRAFEIDTLVYVLHSDDVIWIYNDTDSSHPEKLTLSKDNAAKLAQVLRDIIGMGNNDESN